MTVFNYFFDTDREGHEDVVKLFEAVKAGKFEGYTSEYVVQELKKAPEPKRSNMTNLIEKYGLIVLDSKPEVEDLAEQYIKQGVIPASQLFDSLHVSFASVYELDCIISYNFQHINRSKTKNLSIMVNNWKGYAAIMIATAKEVLEIDAESL